MIGNKIRSSDAKLNASELLIKLIGIDINICPCCGKGKMIIFIS
jgi:hypothetical protein